MVPNRYYRFGTFEQRSADTDKSLCPSPGSDKGFLGTSDMDSDMNKDKVRTLDMFVRILVRVLARVLASDMTSDTDSDTCVRRSLLPTEISDFEAF